MTRTRTGLTLVLSLVVTVVGASARVPGRPSLAVLPVTSDAMLQLPSAQLAELQRAIVSELEALGRFEVVSPRDPATGMASGKRQATVAAELGRQLGVRYVMTSHAGTVPSRTDFVLASGIIDAETGEIVWADEAVGRPDGVDPRTFKGSDEELGALIDWLLEAVGSLDRRLAAKPFRTGG